MYATALGAAPATTVLPDPDAMIDRVAVPARMVGAFGTIASTSTHSSLSVDMLASGTEPRTDPDAAASPITEVPPEAHDVPTQRCGQVETASHSPRGSEASPPEAASASSIVPGCAGCAETPICHDTAAPGCRSAIASLSPTETRVMAEPTIVSSVTAAWAGGAGTVTRAAAAMTVSAVAACRGPAGECARALRRPLPRSYRGQNAHVTMPAAPTVMPPRAMGLDIAATA